MVVASRNSIMHNGNVKMDSKTAFELLKKLMRSCTISIVISTLSNN